MDIAVFIELFITYASQLGTFASFVVLATIMGYVHHDGKKDRKNADKRFDEVLERQDDMMEDYKAGFVKVDKSLVKINQKIDNLELQQNENSLLTLRSIITNKSLPVDYRLASFDTYKSKGGNSWIQDYVNKEILKSEG